MKIAVLLLLGLIAALPPAVHAADRQHGGDECPRTSCRESETASLPEPGEWWPAALIVLAALAGFGAFGGMLAAWGQVPLTDVLKNGLTGTYTNWGRIHGITFLGAMWGAGGGLAFGVILALDEKFRDLASLDAERFLFISCAAVAAGFSGIRLLRLVSGKLEEQVNKAKQDAEEAKEQVNQVKAGAEKARLEIERIVAASQQLTVALTFASQVLATFAQKGAPLADDHFSVSRAIEMMEESRQTNPGLRLVGIYLGRLHKVRGRFDDAVAALTAVYAARGEPRNKDDAALLYNRACYTNQLRLSATVAAEQQRYLAAAQKDLDESIRLDSNNATEAKTDEELAGLEGGPVV